MALKKALFKPAAFFKGIILPLCEVGVAMVTQYLPISAISVTRDLLCYYEFIALVCCVVEDVYTT